VPTVDEAPWIRPETSDIILPNSGGVVRIGGDRAFYPPITSICLPNTRFADLKNLSEQPCTDWPTGPATLLGSTVISSIALAPTPMRWKNCAPRLHRFSWQTNSISLLTFPITPAILRAGLNPEKRQARNLPRRHRCLVRRHGIRFPSQVRPRPSDRSPFSDCLPAITTAAIERPCR
jgi:hypothetical protein